MNQTLNINFREAESDRVQGIVTVSSSVDRQVRGAGRSVIERGIRFHYLASLKGGGEELIKGNQETL